MRQTKKPIPISSAATVREVDAHTSLLVERKHIHPEVVAVVVVVVVVVAIVSDAGHLATTIVYPLETVYSCPWESSDIF